MAALSVEEFSRKLANFIATDHEVNKEAFIKDAWVCGRNNKNYPEGTVVLEVVDNNTTIENLEMTTHELTIYPTRLGQLN